MLRRDFLAGLFAGLFPVVVGCSKTNPLPATDADATPTEQKPKPKNPFRNDSPGGETETPEKETVEQPCAGCAGSGKVPGYCDTCKGTGRCWKCFGTGTEPCQSCEGKGQLPGRRLNNNCSYCNGRGDVACSKCEGKGKGVCKTCDGKEVKDTCPSCRGRGTVRVPKP